MVFLCITAGIFIGMVLVTGIRIALAIRRQEKENIEAITRRFQR
jgi:hypothetical protein